LPSNRFSVSSHPTTTISSSSCLRSEPTMPRI
jgi:hypothetical protein